ncbi:TonB-dependent siderophore receptor [Pseudomonas phytophila]|uniref:TonB-dependent siderophore receptor n=1 Tax=Pseudomonas phytophila TaxID=2867264 RepID=A0ABY6FC90_9PSED|nr:TonB-dependent siderophore receptor [Pseudomonas phytophila]UXZ95515.1 TonB-dependent siderophore receptor [Pseudomonas phytophila]
MSRPALSALTIALALGFSANAFAAPVRLDIPAQPLAASLAQLGKASGMTVTFDPQQVAGKQAPTVSGNLEPAQALQRLLVGSGLTASVEGNSARVIQPQPTQGAIALDGVNINADYGLAGVATTEGTNSYTTGSMSTATKLPLSIRETPQSVSVITRQRIEDQGMNDVNDVVKYAPGVTLRKFGQDRQQFLARGFTIDNLMYDGLPTILSTFTQDTLAEADLALYDRVEVVRGATGLMTGSGSPSATLNLVRKRPTATPQVSITTSAGSWDRYRTEVDASNKLNDSGTVRGRVVAAYQDEKSFVDERNKQRQTFYGILEADLNDATTWTIGASKQKDDATSDWGSLPSGRNGENLGFSRSTFLSGDWAYWNRDNVSVFTDLTHRFDNGWNAKLAASKIWAESDTFSNYLSFPFPDPGVGYEQGAGQYDTKDTQTNLDGSFSGPFTLFGREHDLSVGVSHRQEKFDQRGGFWAGYAVDPFNINPGTVPKPTADTRTAYASKNVATENAAYAVARFNPIDPLHVIVGSRLSWYDYDNQSGTGDYKVTQEVTPYAGVIYDLNDTYSVYASYTEIFKPQSEQNIAGSALKPMTGESYEIGLKGEYFDGALNASVALFDMTQENRAYAITPQPASCTQQSRTCNQAAGEVRSRGIDTEISGAITPNWQVSAAYTYLLSQYVKDADNEGRRFGPDQPKQLFKAATSYNLEGDLNKWRVGADVLAQSDTFNRVGTANGHATQDAYSVVGLMAGYKFDEHWDGRVNFNNVFDTKYWQGIPTGSGSGVYGDPRNLMFSVKWTL